MRKRTYRVTIEVKVQNPKRFRAAARRQAEADGIEFDDQWITDCAILLFDPTNSPDGCTVLSSTAEVIE